MKDRKIKTCSDLYEKIKNDEEFILERLRIDLLEEILIIMEKKNMDRAELARQLNTSRAYISKLFNTSVNLTLRTIAKIIKNLDVKLSFHFHEIETQSFWFDVYQNPQSIAHMHPEPPDIWQSELKEIPRKRIKGVKDECRTVAA